MIGARIGVNIPRRIPGAGVPAWAPTTPATPHWWFQFAPGRVWQDVLATVAATTAGHPLARLDALNGPNLVQASVSLQPYLTPLGKVWGARSDNIDDNLGVTATFTAGAKTLAVIFEVFSPPGAASAETIFRLGATPVQLYLRHSGLSSSSAKGWHIGFDRTSSNAACVQGTAPALLSNGIHTLVVRYDGVSAIAASSYRIWLDGTEITTATGGNAAATGNMRILATSSASEVFDGALAELVLWTSALDVSDCIQAAAYLEAMR